MFSSRKTPGWDLMDTSLGHKPIPGDYCCWPYLGQEDRAITSSSSGCWGSGLLPEGGEGSSHRGLGRGPGPAARDNSHHTVWICLMFRNWALIFLAPGTAQVHQQPGAEVALLVYRVSSQPLEIHWKRSFFGLGQESSMVIYNSGTHIRSQSHNLWCQ